MGFSAFAERMAELDVVVELCRGRGPFAAGAVRDTANRSDRDWPEWGAEIAETREDGGERRRVTAGVRLSSTTEGQPGAFKARWRAQIWPGVSIDSFTKWGGRRLDWEVPTPECLQETMAALLEEGWAAIGTALANRAGGARETR